MQSKHLEFPRRVAKVTVTVEMADGAKHVTESRPGAVDPSEGVQIKQDIVRLSDLGSPMQDMRSTRTVTWVEQWTEYERQLS